VITFIIPKVAMNGVMPPYTTIRPFRRPTDSYRDGHGRGPGYASPKRHRYDDGRERGYRADGEINSCGDNYKPLPDGDDRNDRRRQEDVGEIARTEEVGRGQASHHDNQDEKERQDTGVRQATCKATKTSCFRRRCALNDSHGCRILPDPLQLTICQNGSSPAFYDTRCMI
jgi:hypothetical protein